MARRIYIKDGGLNTSSTIPPGYTAIGTDSGDLKKKVVDTISDIGGGGSSKTRVDVLSVGVKSGYGSSTFFGVPEKPGSGNLLWEVVDSNGNYLISDEFYTDINDLNVYVNAQSLNGIDMTVKGYYYLDQSKEKFRLVGRNLAYWSLVGLNNYAKMRNRGNDYIGIDPGILGQSIINTLQDYSINTGYESLAYITNDGKGFVFSTMKGGRICVKLESTFSSPEIITNRTSVNHNTYGIDNSGNLVPLYGETFIGSQEDNIGAALFVCCNTSGGIDSVLVGTDSLPNVIGSLLEFRRIKIFTDNYPDNLNCLFVWYVRPIAHDIILLNNNNSILDDDNIYLIPESRYSSTYLPRIANINTLLDNTGFGQDISNNDTKTGLDRKGNIRSESIPGFGDSHSVVRNFYQKSIKWKVAYGKSGNYTLSDDYILVKSRKSYYTAMVNRI
jgi:hypothetical protein